ncbi:MAG: nucleotide sugar dehydrogenase [Bdellovibrionales bacterium]
MIEVQLVVIGDWHLAYCTAVSFSHSGVKTILKLSHHGDGHDKAQRSSSEKTLEPGTPSCPIQEPGFEDLVQEGRNQNTLFHTRDWSGFHATVWWLAVDTPVDDQDMPQTEVLVRTLEEGFQFGRKPLVLAVSSQVPVGFCRKLQERFGTPVAYVPENLRLGQGIETFYRADRTVIGADDLEAGVCVRKLMGEFPTEFLMTNLATAEMVKHATNFFLAMSISYANELARIGQRFGVDHAFITSALKADKRIGPFAYVKPGLGFAGGTLPRDLRVLQGLGQELNVPVPVTDAVLKVNEQVDDVILDRIDELRRAGKSEKSVLLMGYSYKADVDTVRRSPAERLARHLHANGYSVYGYDPIMNGKDLGDLPKVLRHCSDLNEVPATCSLFVVVTPRPAFKELNWNARPGLTVFDLHGFFKAKDRQSGPTWVGLWE